MSTWEGNNLNYNKPEVGIGIIIINRDNKKVLIGERRGSHAAGKKAFPGGRLEFGETWAECAVRESIEECGEQFKIQVKTEAFIVTNDIMHEDNVHFVTIFMVAHVIDGEPENKEPHKNVGWEWLTLEELIAINDNLLAGWIPLSELVSRRIELGL